MPDLWSLVYVIDLDNPLLCIWLFFLNKESLIQETVLNDLLIFKFLENWGKFKKDQKAANNLDENVSSL